jgi:hypothetical protein
MRDSDFFTDVLQIDIEIGGRAGKTPTFYYDAGSISAAFPAHLRALRELMPDPCYVPARLAPGLGVIAIECLEYRDTDVGPYNEVAISVLLNDPPCRLNVPGRALVTSSRTRRHDAYIWHIPVTTDVALRGGVDFYGFPKFIADIDFDEPAERRRCRLAEGSKHILTLTGERLPTPGSGQVDIFCRLWMDGQPQAARFRKRQLNVAATFRPGAARLDLGADHPIARQLDRLLVSHRSLHYEFCPRFEAILFGPDHLTLPLVERGLEAAAVLATPNAHRATVA